MAWHVKKDINYYNRLTLINKVKKYVETNLEFHKPYIFTQPIPYSYDHGKKMILSIERVEYYSCFKRVFKTIRVNLSDNTYIRLVNLRMKHLTKIYQALIK